MSSTTSVQQRAEQVHRAATIVDALDVSRFDAAHFLKMQRGGITAANATIIMPTANFRQAVDGILDFDQLMERCADLVMPVHGVRDIEAARSAGKVGVIYGFQNATAIEGDLRLLKVFHRLGVRIIQLTYMTANNIGVGCLEPHDAGLTLFGRAVVREMNRLGLLIDLSHVGERTSLDAAELSETPVAITHACARGLVDHPRNKSDDVIRAVAERGGVMGITSLPDFVCHFERGETPTLEHYLRQIDYVVNLVGVDHVGIGMDYVEGQSSDFVYSQNWGGAVTQAEPVDLLEIVDRLGAGQETSVAADGSNASPQAVWPRPYAIRDSSQMMRVTEGLLGAGYGEADVHKILGGNWLRLFGAVWTA
jgi:membrane dipeptidase